MAASPAFAAFCSQAVHGCVVGTRGEFNMDTGSRAEGSDFPPSDICRDHHLDIDETGHHDDTLLMTMAKGGGGGITGAGEASEAVGGLQNDSLYSSTAATSSSSRRPIPPTRLLIRASANANLRAAPSPLLQRCVGIRRIWVPPPPLPPRFLQQHARWEAGAREEKEKRFPAIVYPREQARRRYTRRTRSPSPLPHSTPTLTSSSSSTFPPEPMQSE
ncbi:hypothetical protein C8R45DRAFT_1183477 [Mycena sanguinolenta]|nr:hypothetical protein C8R45DRAFT_1183477 [Mycena sanguinolenta]